MYHQVDRLRRDMRNNGRIYEDVAKILKENVVSSRAIFPLKRNCRFCVVNKIPISTVTLILRAFLVP